MASPQIGVAILHGIGSQEPDFADPFIQGVQSRLSLVGADPALFEFAPICWASVLTGSQKSLYRALQRGGPMDWPAARMFVIEALADAVAYRRGYSDEWDVYNRIHREVFLALAELRDKLPDANAPLVIVAHSLGSVVMSDHIWDAQHGRALGSDAFTSFGSLAGIVTMGSAIPLFLLGIHNIQCITFPSLSYALTPRVRQVARWLNYYDRDDILGHPLRTLSDSFRKTIAADVEVNSGSPLTSWNPLSHTGYWTEPGVLQDIAKQLRDVADAHLAK